MYKLLLPLLVFSSALLCPQSATGQTFASAVRRTENFADGKVSTDVKAESRALYKTGLEQLDSGQVSQAALSFEQALKLSPDYAEAYEALGRSYFKMRQWQKAIDSFRRAASLNTKAKEQHE